MKLNHAKSNNKTYDFEYSDSKHALSSIDVKIFIFQNKRAVADANFFFRNTI